MAKTLTEIKDAFAAGKVPSAGAFSDLVDTLASQSASASQSSQTVVIPLGPGTQGALLKAVRDSRITWEGHNNDDDYMYPIWAEELIKIALESLGKGDLYEDMTTVILHNDYFNGIPYTNSVHVRDNIYVKTWNDYDSGKPNITVIPLGGMAMFGRSLMWNELYPASSNAEDKYHEDIGYRSEEISSGWRPVGTTISITEEELSANQDS